MAEIRESTNLVTILLLSCEKGFHAGELRLSGREMTPECPFDWQVSQSTLSGGTQHGIDLVTVDNGRMRFSLVPTRGMGLLEARCGDVRLGWDSPVRQVVHPSFIRLDSRGGLGWLEGFNEWVVRCGLEWAGAPGPDEFTTNTGARSAMSLSLHGRIANLPASEVEVQIEKSAPWRISVVGKVCERIFYGPKLELAARVSTEAGSTGIRLTDRVTNCGASEEEFQLIYHTNYGPPLLGEGSSIEAPVARVFPTNEHSAEEIGNYSLYRGPTRGFIEQVYCMQLYGDAQGMTSVVLRNGAGDRGIATRYRLEQLPCFTLWKNSAALEDGYVTGLEPGTGFPFNRSIERRFRRVPRLGAGESREFALDFLVLGSSAEVQRELKRVGEIQKDRRTEVERTPPSLDPSGE